VVRGPAFTVEVAREPDCVRIALRGELDLATVDQAHEALSRTEVRPSNTVVLDLSRVTFIDSSGLRFVLLADRRAQEEGWHLQLVPAPPEVQRIFRTTRLEERLPFVGR
jgi:anti-sigma B factor antagonist